jgi:hypothetical protein
MADRKNQRIVERIYEYMKYDTLGDFVNIFVLISVLIIIKKL